MISSIAAVIMLIVGVVNKDVQYLIAGAIFLVGAELSITNDRLTRALELENEAIKEEKMLQIVEDCK